jgi:hypothetical protein
MTQRGRLLERNGIPRWVAVEWRPRRYHADSLYEAERLKDGARGILHPFCFCSSFLFARSPPLPSPPLPRHRPGSSAAVVPDVPGRGPSGWKGRRRHLVPCSIGCVDSSPKRGQCAVGASRAEAAAFNAPRRDTPSTRHCSSRGTFQPPMARVPCLFFSFFFLFLSFGWALRRGGIQLSQSATHMCPNRCADYAAAIEERWSTCGLCGTLWSWAVLYVWHSGDWRTYDTVCNHTTYPYNILIHTCSTTGTGSIHAPRYLQKRCTANVKHGWVGMWTCFRNIVMMPEKLPGIRWTAWIPLIRRMEHGSSRWMEKMHRMEKIAVLLPMRCAHRQKLPLILAFSWEDLPRVQRNGCLYGRLYCT